MNKELLQMIFLVTSGKAYLEGKVSSFDEYHPYAYNYHNIYFVSKLPVEAESISVTVLAENPNDWLTFLQREKVHQLHLTYQPSSDFIQKPSQPLTSIEKRHSWHIIAEKKSGYDVWRSKWITEASGEEITYYYLFQSGITHIKLSFLSLEMTKLYLKEIFSDLIAFTIRNNLDKWTETYKAALRSLSSKRRSHLLPGILPKRCYSLAARQVLAACERAWVFGGKGSWNDVTNVHDYDLYSRLTANLQNTLYNSIVSAVNSFP